jgi:hypothetical protein
MVFPVPLRLQQQQQENQNLNINFFELSQKLYKKMKKRN